MPPPFLLGVPQNWIAPPAGAAAEADAAYTTPLAPRARPRTTCAATRYHLIPSDHGPAFTVSTSEPHVLLEAALFKPLPPEEPPPHGLVLLAHELVEPQDPEPPEDPERFEDPVSPE